MKLRHFVYVFVLVLFLASCDYKMIEEIEADIPEDGVSFSEQIQPIIDDNCVSCHGNAGGLDMSDDTYSTLINGAADDGTPYIDTESAADSYLLIKLGQDSHSSYASAQEIGLIEAWIEAGAENN